MNYDDLLAVALETPPRSKRISPRMLAAHLRLLDAGDASSLQRNQPYAT